MSQYKIVVIKSTRSLKVYSLDGTLIKTCSIDLGREPIGAKQFEGDKKTPEGWYLIDAKSETSAYFLNLNINYPLPKDVEFAESQGKQPGGQIKIHGQPNDPTRLPHYPCKDWTSGCIAVTNAEIQELFDLIEPGTPIEILP